MCKRRQKTFAVNFKIRNVATKPIWDCYTFDFIDVRWLFLFPELKKQEKRKKYLCSHIDRPMSDMIFCAIDVLKYFLV